MTGHKFQFWMRRCYQWKWLSIIFKQTNHLFESLDLVCHLLLCQGKVRDKWEHWNDRLMIVSSVETMLTQDTSSITSTTLQLTWRVCLPLQARWRYSSSCALPPPCRLSSCGAAWACRCSGCSCWAGTDWRAWQLAARWQRSVEPACHPFGHRASSCGGRRTRSHCRGLGRRGETGVKVFISVKYAGFPCLVWEDWVLYFHFQLKSWPSSPPPQHPTPEREREKEQTQEEGALWIPPEPAPDQHVQLICLKVVSLSILKFLCS